MAEEVLRSLKELERERDKEASRREKRWLIQKLRLLKLDIKNGQLLLDAEKTLRIKQRELMELKLKNQETEFKAKISKLETELKEAKQLKTLEDSVIEKENTFRLKNAKNKIRKLEKVIETIRTTLDTDAE